MQPAWRETLRRFQAAISILLLILAAAAFSSSRSAFFQWGTVESISGQVAVTGVLAIGMTFVILTGGIDLSVGSMCAVVAIVGAKMASSGYPPLPTSLAMLGLGCCLGTLNGLLVAYTTVQPFVITLASMASLRGAAYLISPNNISGFPKLFAFFQSYVYGIPFQSVLLIGSCAISWVVLTKTVFGRQIYAVGGNETAAMMSATPVARTKIFAYAISGFCVAIAAMLLIARTNNGEPAGANGYELDAIAAVVIGGCSLMGGSGSVLGTMLGAVFMQMLGSLMIWWGIEDKLALLLKGPIILVAVLLQSSRRR